MWADSGILEGIVILWVPDSVSYQRSPAIIVLAAGRGSRFEGEGPKLAQNIDQRSILEQTVLNALSSGLPTVVVTHKRLAPLACQILASRDVAVIEEGHPGGIDQSIASGVGLQPDASGWLLLPGDMPLIKPETLRVVAQALRQYPAVYAQHHGLRGHPLGFASELYSELIVLRGHEGGRKLLARYPAFGVEVPDPGILIDVDTQADLLKVREDYRLLDVART